MKNEPRIVLGMFLSPLFPAVGIVILPVFATLSWPFRSHEVFFLLGWSIPVSYFGALLFGWPAFSLLRRFNALNLINLLSAGTLAGVVALVFLSWLFASVLGSSISVQWSTLVWGAGLGMLCAMPFAAITGITSLGKGHS